MGTLEVRLHSGKHMKRFDFVGKNDPYAIVSYKNQHQKSATLQGGGSEPVWNESFFFLVGEKEDMMHNNMNDTDTDKDDDDVIQIKVFDEDKHTADDLIGEARIPLGDVLTELVVPARAYDLQKSSSSFFFFSSKTKKKTYGQIEVSLKFSRKQQQQQISEENSKPSIASSPRDFHHHHQTQKKHHDDNQYHPPPPVFQGPYGNNNEGGWK